MSSPHPLDGAYAQAERSIEQIGHLNTEIRAFLKLNPYRQVAEKNPDSEYGGIVRGFIDKEPPIRFSVLAGEIVHNMRTVFDYIVWQLVIRNGKSGNRNTGFPVCDTAHEYETNGIRKVERASPDAQALIESLQPYHGGDRLNRSPLWRLHHLDRIHKHRTLHVIGCAAVLGRAWFLRPQEGEVAEVTLNMPRVRRLKDGRAIIPFKNGAELFRVGSDYQEMKMRYEISFDVAFQEPGILPSSPVVPALNELMAFTASTFDTFLHRFFPEGVEGVEGAHQK